MLAQGPSKGKTDEGGGSANKEDDGTGQGVGVSVCESEVVWTGTAKEDMALSPPLFCLVLATITHSQGFL